VHKHGQGQLLGYEKRVHLDQLIPQKRYQDTYARLKTKYGRHLAEEWVEVTDPGKHVFEDIGIAAFLIELWRDMYSWEQRENFNGAKEIETSKPPFPGFVDIGCGNGVLVYILIVEGYDGWGFDARERKTWSIFPDQVQQRLQRCVLIPWIFGSLDHGVAKTPQHDGRFQSGTFIISNHADELTTWTPLLAYVNKSAFIAIPCCSHDLAGSRFRAPASIKGSRMRTTRLPQQIEADDDGSDSMRSKGETKQAAETGSLKRTDAQKKMPSAYSTLCSYVTSLAEELGFEPEKEVLRIPSTRNQCIIGQRGLAFEWSENQQENNEGRQRKVVQVVERELGRSVGTVGAEWITRAQNLSKKPGSGH
jgi:tRNASer (uridine44-2'-O)-methyltransferase